MKSHARVGIIGGGAMGAGLAYHLGLEGWTDTVLVEKGELTSGSTWHAAGQCPSFIGDYNMAKVHHYSNTLYPRLEALTGQYVSWHGAGGLRIATTPEEVDWFRHVAGFAPNVGFHLEVVEPRRARELNPFLNTDGVLACAWTAMDGHVDPAGVCNAMAKGARDLGVAVMRRNRVLDVTRRAGGEWTLHTEQGPIVVEHVVNAAGCHAREVAAMMGTVAPIANMEHHYLVTEAIEAFIDRDEEIPVMRDPWASCYYRQEQKAGLVGIYERDSTEAWTRSGNSPAWESENELFPESLDRVLPHVEKVFRRMPVYANAGIKRIVCGAISHTPDGNPLLGPAPGLSHGWMCCGASIGIAQGGGAGKYLAQWMVHGDAEINMAGVDPRRFGRYAGAAYTAAKSCQDYAHMYGAHLPGEELPAGRPARRSTLHDRLEAKGARHTEAFGWERPKWFSPDGRREREGFRRNNTHDIVAAECRAVRERVGLLDLSSFAKFEIAGADAGAFLDRVFANRMPRKPGGIVLAHRLGENGRIRGESTVTLLPGGRYYLLSGAAWESRDEDAFREAKRSGEDVAVTNVSDEIGILVLAGPRAREVLASVADADLGNEAFPWLSAREIRAAGVPLRALRINYVGSLGWELHAPMARLPELYDALWSAGTPHGIADFGAYALDSLRLEKGYRGMAVELTNEITPVEADILRFVKRDKDFAGKAAVEAVLRAGHGTRLVHAEVDAVDADARGGEPVFDGERCVGVTTSGGYGHHTGKSLVFAYVEPELATAGSRFDIAILGERRRCTVLAEAAYDPLNAAPRA